jgi:hypothetical protein
VDVVRRYVEAQNGTSEEVLTPARELWDVTGDYYPIRKFPEARPCHGLQEICQFIVRSREAWSELAYRVHKVIEVADDRVLARTTLQASGRDSEIKLESDLYLSVWLREGRLIRVEDHLTLRGALRALGIEDEALEAAGLGD